MLRSAAGHLWPEPINGCSIRYQDQLLANPFTVLLLFGSSAFAFVLNFLKSKAPSRAFLFGIFRVLHTVQSLIFKVRCCCFLKSSLLILPHLFCFVNNFSKFLFEIFHPFFFCVPRSHGASLIIANLFTKVNNFFKFFHFFLFFHFLPHIHGNSFVTPWHKIRTAAPKWMPLSAYS